MTSFHDDYLFPSYAAAEAALHLPEATIRRWYKEGKLPPRAEAIRAGNSKSYASIPIRMGDIRKLVDAYNTRPKRGDPEPVPVRAPSKWPNLKNRVKQRREEAEDPP